MISSALYGGVRMSAPMAAARFVVAPPLGYNIDNQTRNMATLKEVKARIRSVTTIQKITKSMKLVATTRLKKAEDAFEMNKPSYLRMDEFLMEMKADSGFVHEDKPDDHNLLCCLTTEKGLCGSVNGTINRIVKNISEEHKESKSTVTMGYVLLGNKAVQGLTRECGEETNWSAKDLGGRSGPKFVDVLPVADKLTDEKFNNGTMIRNKFINLLAFDTLQVPMVSKDHLLEMSANSYEFDSGDKEETMKNFHAWFTAVSLYSYLVETNCIEIGQRMTSMDNATKNAGDLIKKLTMLYNRRRQAKITTEITEIVSGAAAVEEDL